MALFLTLTSYNFLQERTTKQTNKQINNQVIIMKNLKQLLCLQLHSSFETQFHLKKCNIITVLSTGGFLCVPLLQASEAEEELDSGILGGVTKGRAVS